MSLVLEHFSHFYLGGADLLRVGCTHTENNDDQSKLNNSMEHVFNQSWSSEDFRHNIEYQHNPLSGASSSSTGFDVLSDNTYLTNTTESLLIGGDNEKDGSIGQSEKVKEDDEGENDGPTAADQWKTCAICLEEMIDSDLMAHASCGGTLCHTCLEVGGGYYQVSRDEW